MDRPIRVLVANRPRLMRELILNTFSDQPDVVVVDEVSEEVEIPAAVERTDPDFVIITQDTFGERPSVCDIVLRRHPKTQIIAIVPHQSLAVYYRASATIDACNIEASEQAILGVLRTQRSPLVA